MADLKILLKNLGVAFKNSSLLEIALTHGSYINEKSGISQVSNQRMEFLGDAVLGLLIAEQLYKSHPEYSEGELTRLRAALVKSETLSRVARSVELGEYIYLGKGEEKSGGRQKPINLASALEALIAAIYLDGGMAKTRECIFKLFKTEIQQVLQTGNNENYKTELQQVIQSRTKTTPEYVVVSREGPVHNQLFTVEARSNGTTLGKGSGNSKKEAEINAARAALERLG